MSAGGHAGRVALVTGGASGIGREICRGLAAAGRRVAVADLDDTGAVATVELIGAAGGEAVAIHLDVTDSAGMTRAVDEVNDRLGAVEILVNCAGWDELRPFVDTDEDFWARVIDVNFTGMLRTVHACLPAMVDAGWGRIVNIGSDAARVGSSLEAVYSGAKGGVISFTKTIAREVARRGVTANAVCPGPTATPLLDGIVAASDDGEKVIGAMARAVPMKRVGEPEEVASAVVYFASDDAGFVTGQTLSVSGGLTMA
ncbi:MAG: SDR family oxidoreductase [Actinomycetota bacterium]